MQWFELFLQVILHVSTAASQWKSGVTRENRGKKSHTGFHHSSPIPPKGISSIDELILHINTNYIRVVACFSLSLNRFIHQTPTLSNSSGPGFSTSIPPS